jgi:hypothetical protein
MNPEPPAKPDYSVNIESVEPAYFKVVWTRGLRYRSYLIDKGDIETIAHHIRTQLGLLVNNALDRERATAANDAVGIAAAGATEREIMMVLTGDCGELFAALFTCAPGSDAGQSHVNEIRNRIRGEKTPKSICFLVKARIYVPWGLLYDGAPAANANPATPEDFGGFWCLKHQVSVIFDALASPIDFVVTYDSKSFHVLTGGDASEFIKARRAFRSCSAERKLMANLSKVYGRPAVSSDALIKAWTDVEHRLGLLYLFCHADARTVGFSVSDTMSVIKFKNALVKSTTSPRCLVFLNGCFTTNPDAKGTFLEATGRHGFCGYIGAETEVPALFSFRFGLAFQYFFHQGLEVAEIMTQLLRKHWPLSLIYGLYAFPHLRMTPNSGIGPPPPPDVNYSAGPLGEKIA